LGIGLSALERGDLCEGRTDAEQQQLSSCFPLHHSFSAFNSGVPWTWAYCEATSFQQLCYCSPVILLRVGFSDRCLCRPVDTKDILVMLSDMDINAIAGTLKLYFRELPEPLLTDRLYRAFMEGIGATFRPPDVCVCHQFAQLEEERGHDQRAVSPELDLTSFFFFQGSRTRQPRRTA